MKILITGGAGYIGSFMTKALLDRGDDVTVFDNLKRGHKDVVDNRAKLVVGDITNKEDLNNLFADTNFDAAIHFAGLIAVGESEENPKLYHENNVTGSSNFFETALGMGNLNKFIFSSSAAVYGNPIKVPIPEDHPKNPTSEYGKNKLEVEYILTKLSKENPEMSFAALRYFNAAGGALDGSMGEMHEPETHIIPNIFKAIKDNSQFNLFGNDYKTPDGTNVRDYIHVNDLVSAHMLALDKLNVSKGGYFYNVGTGKGFSNLEVIKMAEKISGKKVNVNFSPRRPGDADELVADPAKIKNELRFNPKDSDLETIIGSAWHFFNK